MRVYIHFKGVYSFYLNNYPAQIFYCKLDGKNICIRQTELAASMLVLQKDIYQQILSIMQKSNILLVRKGLTQNKNQVLTSLAAYLFCICDSEIIEQATRIFSIDSMHFLNHRFPVNHVEHCVVSCRENFLGFLRFGEYTLRPWGPSKPLCFRSNPGNCH